MGEVVNDEPNRNDPCPKGERVAIYGSLRCKYSEVVADAGIVLHYPQVDGIYQPISAEPLRKLLRQKGYSFRGQSGGTLIEIDSSTFRIWNDQRDRTDITFRFTYQVTVPRQPETKINVFEIERDWT
ncbi:hypothetical protein BRIN106911_11750 [Brevibacillus invocatus]